jgi:hypothetical protein
MIGAVGCQIVTVLSADTGSDRHRPSGCSLAGFRRGPEAGGDRCKFVSGEAV